MTPKFSIQQSNPVAVAAFMVCLAAGIIATVLTKNPAYVIAGVLVGLYLLCAIKIVRQWEKAIKLRFGALRGPARARHVFDRAHRGDAQYLRRSACARSQCLR